ncbi:MAG: hypothetical protein ABIH90_02430 [Candidatus Aenigmatarchaeota archaeon]
MNGEITAIVPAVYTVLIIGVGYITLWAKYQLVNRSALLLPSKKTDFYKLNPYDKAMQSLIAGLVVLSMSCLFSLTPYSVISNIENLLNSGKLAPILYFEFIAGVVTAAMWGAMELRVFRTKDLKLKKSKRKKKT